MAASKAAKASPDVIMPKAKVKQYEALHGLAYANRDTGERMEARPGETVTLNDAEAESFLGQGVVRLLRAA